jgi:para-nitrobenzyl esterase
MADVIVETRYGKVAGSQEGDVRVWRGVPFARAPVGNLRFQPPEPPHSWAAVRDAKAFGPICPQVNDSLFPTPADVAVSEDCLSLNIWAPADGTRHPVLVWIHGGGFVFGSGRSPWYDGSAFSRLGIVVVTINYRLGPLGFLHLEDVAGSAFAPSGNVGLLDQLAALEWVRDNIASFGGDPSRVTVAGESAGSMSVGALLVMPRARGLFAQAVMESGVPFFRRREEAAETADRLVAKLGGVDAVLGAPPDRLVAAAQELPSGPGLRWGPMADGHILPSSFWTAVTSGHTHPVPLLIGTNRHELRLWGASQPTWRTLPDDEMVRTFERNWGTVPAPARRHFLDGRHGQALFDALMHLGTMRVFEAPSHRLAARHSQRAPVWVYRFDWESPAYGGVLGACHALEIPFVFNNLSAPGVRPFTGDGPDRQAVADAMQASWAAFVRSGNPQHPGIPEWPRYDPDHRATLLFNVTCQVDEDPDGPDRKVWDQLADAEP